MIKSVLKKCHFIEIKSKMNTNGLSSEVLGYNLGVQQFVFSFFFIEKHKNVNMTTNYVHCYNIQD